MTGWIFRTFKTRKEKCMLTLRKTLVLPKLEYCCLVWSPHKTQDITTLEALQKTFTGKVQGVHNLTYWEKLRHFKLYFLQRRREWYIIIYIWKIPQSTPNMDMGFQESIHPKRGRVCYLWGTARYCETPKSTNINKELFLSQWNSPVQLPASRPPNFYWYQTRELKSKLAKWLNTIPVEPLTPGYSSSHRNTLLEDLLLECT